MEPRPVRFWFGREIVFCIRVLTELLRLIGSIPDDIEGDAFGKIYEYFLSNFAFSEGQRGGEFFTPTSIVKLIVDIIEPFDGRILDPACGSGGMFVQSAKFVQQHKADTRALSIYGQERVEDTIRLAKMNLDLATRTMVILSLGVGFTFTTFRGTVAVFQYFRTVRSSARRTCF